jgi:Fe-S-cluster-containing hydrogenase component 2
MKKVTTKAVYDYSKCTGCHTCTYVCPFYVVTNPVDRPLEKDQTPPCRNECLSFNDVEGFITLTEQRKFFDAWKLIPSRCIKAIVLMPSLIKKVIETGVERGGG